MLCSMFPFESFSCSGLCAHYSKFVLAYHKSCMDCDCLEASTVPFLPFIPAFLPLSTPFISPPSSLVWSTLNATKPTVRWGTTSGTYTDSSPSKWSTYTDMDMCGSVAKGFGWREPGLIHVAVMDK